MQKSLLAPLVLESVHAAKIGLEHADGDGYHAGFDDPCPDTLAAADADVDNALESQTPLPYCLHLLDGKSTKLGRRGLWDGSEDANETLETSIQCDHFSDAWRGRGEIGEMVERIDERQGGGAVDGCKRTREGKERKMPKSDRRNKLARRCTEEHSPLRS